MKKLLLMAVVAAATLSSCGGGISKVSNLSTMSDSVSYAYGTFVGSSLKSQFGESNDDLDVEVLAAAIKSALQDTSALLTQEEIQSTLQHYFTVTKPAKDQAVDSEYLEKVMAENPEAVKTESGLVYQIIEMGDENAKAVLGDTISVLYTGTYTNGEVFDSTSTRGDEPTQFPLGDVIAGWNEGMQLVGKGGKIKLWIPGELAYGDKLMVFDVELVEVTPKAE